MSQRQFFQGIIRTPLSSLRAGSLRVLFARVTWSRDLRAGGEASRREEWGEEKFFTIFI